MEAKKRLPMRVLAWCVMSNHWHLVLWPRGDGDLSEFMRWLTVTHTQRWHAAHHTSGTGPLYQGRFKSFPIQEDDHLLTVLRYVERNPLRANLVKRADEWRWSSLWHRVHGAAAGILDEGPLLCRGIGDDTSSRRRRRRSWRHYGVRWCVALHLERMRGKIAPQSVWACNPPCVRAAAPGNIPHDQIRNLRLPTPLIPSIVAIQISTPF